MRQPYTLAPDEKLSTIVRRHPISLVAPVVSALACFVVAVILPVFISTMTGTVAATTAAQNSLSLVVAIVSAILVFLGLIIVIICWFQFKNNYLVITDQNLVIVEQGGLFSQKVYQSSMANIEDVKARRVGIMPTVFNYGQIEVQTASEDDTRFSYAPNATALADQILQAHVEFIKTHPDWR